MEASGKMPLPLYLRGLAQKIYDVVPLRPSRPLRLIRPLGFPMNPPNHKALTIAGSDSGGGAGLQADLKVFASLGVHGSCVVTAVTAQNSMGVSGVWLPPPDSVRQQFDAVMEDIGADAAKTGMLGSAEIMRSLLGAMESHPIPNLVVDPVMVASTGRALIDDEGIELYRTRWIPICRLITPNIDEAAILTGIPDDDADFARRAAERLVQMGAKAALIKGGHAKTPDRCADLLFDGEAFHEFASPRIATQNTHGTGCALSAAVTAHLARGENLIEAVRLAKTFITRAIENSYAIGKGAGVLDLTPQRKES